MRNGHSFNAYYDGYDESDEENEMNQEITDGIDIVDWRVKHGDDVVTYSMWDFAGQSVYYNTHQVKYCSKILCCFSQCRTPPLPSPLAFFFLSISGFPLTVSSSNIYLISYIVLPLQPSSVHATVEHSAWL